MDVPPGCISRDLVRQAVELLETASDCWACQREHKRDEVFITVTMDREWFEKAEKLAMYLRSQVESEEIQ